MYVVLTAATHNEVAPAAAWLLSDNGPAPRHETELLITGVGSAATAHALTRSIYRRRPDLVIQAGIGGSFTDRLPPPALAFIGEDLFADLGAMERDGFSDLFDMGFLGENEYPFHGRMLRNPHPERWEGFGLPFVRGGTVSNISASAARVTSIIEKYDPHIESMEGAAMHYVCLQENIPFIQLRAVSNYAGDRNKQHWKIPEAIAVLNDQLIKILTSL